VRSARRLFGRAWPEQLTRALDISARRCRLGVTRVTMS
jgi:hypothetical protein